MPHNSPMSKLTAFILCLCALAACHSSQTSKAQPPAAHVTGTTTAAEPWYESEIRSFEAADRDHPPAPGQILFTGSSSIRMWTTLARDMAPWPVLNRGFGGSKTGEVLEVMDHIVLPYRPSMIVYYCGDNDLGDTNTDSAAAAQGFITFCERVHAKRAGTPILYLSIKPSVARWKNWEAMRRANELVADYANKTPNVSFVDVASCLLSPDGTPDRALFANDGLHLNASGYAKWTAIVRERIEEMIGGKVKCDGVR